MNFYYPNFQNDMRRMLGLIFYSDKQHFVAATGKAFDEERAKRFCKEKKIWIGDTAEEVIRLQGNASDDTLQVIKAFNLLKILQTIPECETIVITGQKAMDTLASVLPLEQQPKVWFFSPCEVGERMVKVYRMPSTSRAYPKPLEAKAEVYEGMFREVRII